MVKSSTVRMNTWDGIYVSKGLALSLFRGNRLCLGVDATGRWRGGQLGGGRILLSVFRSESIRCVKLVLSYILLQTLPECLRG